MRTISTLAKGATFILQEYFYIGQNYSEVKQLLTYDDGTDNQELFKALNDTSGSEVIWMVISYLCLLSSGGIFLSILNLTKFSQLVYMKINE